MDILAKLESVGAALRNDHFVYNSGLHGEVYINKDALYPHTQATSEVCQALAQAAQELAPEIVVGPALGGIILAQWTAHHLSTLLGREILGAYSEKDNQGEQILRRGYDKLVSGKRVLIVEDLTTTGGSVKKLVSEVKKVGGQVVGVVVMLNRGGGAVTEATIGAPFLALDSIAIQTYSASDCPLCAQNRPINTSVGHGQKFLEGKK